MHIYIIYVSNLHIASLKAPRSFFPLSQVPYNATSAESQGSRQSLPSNCHHLCPCLSRSIHVLIIYLCFNYMLNHACSSVWHACRLDLPTSQLACQNCSTGFARQIKAGEEAGFVVSGSSVIWTLSGEWAWICYGKPTSVNKRYVVIDVCWVWLNTVFTIMLLKYLFILMSYLFWFNPVSEPWKCWWVMGLWADFIWFLPCIKAKPKAAEGLSLLVRFPMEGPIQLWHFPMFCFVLNSLAMKRTCKQDCGQNNRLNRRYYQLTWTPAGTVSIGFLFSPFLFYTLLAGSGFAFDSVHSCSLVRLRSLGFRATVRLSAKCFFVCSFVERIWPEMLAACHLQKSHCRLSKDSTRRARSNHIL